MTRHYWISLTYLILFAQARRFDVVWANRCSQCTGSGNQLITEIVERMAPVVWQWRLPGDPHQSRSFLSSCTGGGPKLNKYQWTSWWTPVSTSIHHWLLNPSKHIKTYLNISLNISTDMLSLLSALRPEVGISPGAKDLASSNDVEMKKELYRVLASKEMRWKWWKHKHRLHRVWIAENWDESLMSRLRDTGMYWPFMKA